MPLPDLLPHVDVLSLHCPLTPATRGLSLALARQLLQTTNLPLFATHRSGTGDELKQHVLGPLKDVDPARLHPLQLDLTDEACKDLGPEASARATRAFVTTARYEWMFWDAAWRLEGWPV